MVIVVMKVSKECGENSRLVVCRYPFLKWAPNYTYGNGIDSVWVYQKPFIPNTSLPVIYHDLVEFADHPLHPSNKPHLDKTHVKDVTEQVESSNDSALLSTLGHLLYTDKTTTLKENGEPPNVVNVENKRSSNSIKSGMKV